MELNKNLYRQIRIENLIKSNQDLGKVCNGYNSFPIGIMGNKNYCSIQNNNKPIKCIYLTQINSLNICEYQTKVCKYDLEENLGDC